MERKSRLFFRWPVMFAAGALLGWLLGRLWVRQLRFPQMRVIQRELSQEYGEVEAAFLTGCIQQRLEELYAYRPRFQDHRRQIHLNQLVLPVLALYQILLEKNGDRSQTVAHVQDLIFRSVVGKSLRITRLLQVFPDPFSILRLVVRSANRIAFIGAGFDIRYVQDDNQAIAFNIHRCLYFDVLSAYGAPELTPVFCYFDDFIARYFPAGIAWKRRSTLGRGGPYCDFCYARADKEA